MLCIARLPGTSQAFLIPKLPSAVATAVAWGSLRWHPGWGWFMPATPAMCPVGARREGGVSERCRDLLLSSLWSSSAAARGAMAMLLLHLIAPGRLGLHLGIIAWPETPSSISHESVV